MSEDTDPRDPLLPNQCAEEHPEDTTKRSLFMLNGPAVAEVLVRSFDGLVTSGAVDLSTGLHAVKIDVEGGEMHVLTGMRRTLERDRPRMIVVETIETHLRRAGFTVAAIHAFIRDRGYVAMNDAGVARALELNAVFVPA